MTEHRCPEPTIGLKGLSDTENRHGGRLRVQENTWRPEDGPLRLSGRDSRGRAVKVVGTEEFLCKMLRTFPSVQSATA